jgi:hypothetical protein
MIGREKQKLLGAILAQCHFVCLTHHIDILELELGLRSQ